MLQCRWFRPCTLTSCHIILTPLTFSRLKQTFRWRLGSQWKLAGSHELSYKKGFVQIIAVIRRPLPTIYSLLIIGQTNERKIETWAKQFTILILKAYFLTLILFVCLFVFFGRERLYTGLRLSKLNFWVLVVCRSEWAKRSKRQLTNSLRWPIFIINSVDKITLSCYTAPPTQHQGFFRNLSPFVHRVDLW